MDELRTVAEYAPLVAACSSAAFSLYAAWYSIKARRTVEANLREVHTSIPASALGLPYKDKELPLIRIELPNIYKLSTDSFIY